MSKVAVIRFVAAILASWVVMWLAQRRLPGPLAQGLAFWVMFLILPITFSVEGKGNPKAAPLRRFLGATAGAALVLILNALFMGR